MIFNQKDGLNSAKSVSAHLYLDLGDGNTSEQLVYAGAGGGFQTVTLRDALIWAANGQNSPEGPMIRFYRPGGALGQASLLEGWYFSLDPDTYNGISNYIRNPEYNFFDAIIKPGSLIVAKAPPAEPTPRIHWGEIAPRVGKVKAYVDDYFFKSPNFLEVTFVDKYGTSHPMDWDSDEGYFGCACPLNNDGTAYTRDGTEKILARNAMYYNTDDPRSPQYETQMSALHMSYLPSFEHPHTRVSSFESSSENVRDMFIRGDYAYIANAEAGLVIVNVDPASPKYLTSVGSYPVPVNTSASRISVSGDYAYMTSDDGGMGTDQGEFYIVDINPASPGYLSVVGSYMLPGPFYRIIISGSLAYIANGENGLLIIDVSDPAQLSVKGTCNTPGLARNLFISGGYAYIADGESGLQIIDITQPENPVIVGSYDTVANGLFISNSLAYISSSHNRLLIMDVTDPQNPAFKGSYAPYEYSHDVFVSGSLAYLACEDGLQVLDISNPENPVFIGSCDVNLAAHRLFVSGDYAYLAGGDFGGRRLHAIDINPSSPDYLRTPGSVKTGLSSDLTIADNYAYMAAQWSGLKIVDIDPASPGYLTIAGAYQTQGEANEVYISKGYAYVAAGSAGLQIVNVSNPKAPTIAGSTEIPGSAKSVFVAGNYAYVAYEKNKEGGLKIIDINPLSPYYLTITGAFDDIPYASGVFVSDKYAYVTSRLWSRLRIINVSDPQTPALDGSIETQGEARSVFVSGNYAYVAAGSAGLQVVNILQPKNPIIAGSIDTPGSAVDVYVLDGYALVADSQSGLQVITVFDPRNPAIIGSCDTSEYAWGAFGVFGSGKHVYMADEFGLHIITFK